MSVWGSGVFFRPFVYDEKKGEYDSLLIISLVALACLGLIMIGSASVAIAEKRFGFELRYALQQSVFLIGSVVVALLIFQKTTLAQWREQRGTLLLGSMALILVTLIFGREINGAKRWLSLWFFNLQPSEFLKLVIIVFMAAYLEKNFQSQLDADGNRDWRLEKQLQMKAVKLLLLPLVPIFFLLLMQPDFGSLVVVLLLVSLMLLIAGAPLRLFFSVVPLGLLLVIIIVIEPYRLARVTSFLDPWGDPQNTGYQLTHSLMALGRGEWFGVGLGNSVEKLFYLPDAHTDFLFAIYGEEFGFFGVTLLIALYLFIVGRIYRIGRGAALRSDTFAAMLCYGIASWIAVQVLINMGANLGLLPTKGLTLPLVSYGGSSLLTTMIGLALVFRVDWENRHVTVVIADANVPVPTVAVEATESPSLPPSTSPPPPTSSPSPSPQVPAQEAHKVS